jgi:hypothetical protein
MKELKKSLKKINKRVDVNQNKVLCSVRLKSENIRAWVDFFAIIIDIIWRTYYN